MKKTKLKLTTPEKEKCSNCNKKITRKITPTTRFINIKQKPSHFYFCQKSCKIEFIINLKSKLKSEF